MARHSEDNLSCIMALHRRYEETQVEYLVVESAEAAERKRARDANDDGDLAEAYRRGLQASSRESDVLRTAILHQVPESWLEATVLQFHIVNAFDMIAASDRADENDQIAVQTAIDTLFDFMCCETQESSNLGPSLVDGAARAFRMRRFRTGVVVA